MTDIITTNTPFKTAASCFINYLDDLKEKDKIIIALAGGRSIPDFSLKLNEQISKSEVWKSLHTKLHIFLVDERLVPINDKNSNYRLIKDEMLSKINIPKSNLHVFSGDIDKYKSELLSVGGKYDIVILSSGEDGHVAALYPNHHSILNESDYFILMNDSPKPPSNRMSSSKKLISTASHALLFILGKTKRQALLNFKNKNMNVIDCPAKIINDIKTSHVVTNIVISS